MQNQCLAVPGHLKVSVLSLDGFRDDTQHRPHIAPLKVAGNGVLKECVVGMPMRAG
jgi:hypothetical protein